MKKNWLTALICFVIAITFFAAGFFTNNIIDALNPRYEVQFSQHVSKTLSILTE